MDETADIARTTAQRLTERYGERLPIDVERELAERTPDQYFDPISLGALIVSAATLAWTIYTDQRNRNNTPTQDTLSRQIRIQLHTPRDITTTERDHIIDITVDETLNTLTD